MKPKYFLELTLLASFWGASFMFTRVAVAEMGPVPLTAVRSGIAAVVLFPLLLASGHLATFWRHWLHILVIGLISTALPFCLISFTTQYSSAGFASILNAFTPIFSALIAWLWLRDTLRMPAILGIALGCAGALVLATDNDTLSSGVRFLPLLTGLGATLLYGLTGNYSKRFVSGVPPVVMAAGCQLFAALSLLPAAWLLWPDHSLSLAAWFSLGVLGVICTALAFIMYFHLLTRIGVANTVLVTYLAPAFAMFWGWLILGEQLTTQMLAGTAFIFAGITLTTGVLQRLRRRPLAVTEDTP